MQVSAAVEMSGQVNGGISVINTINLPKFMGYKWDINEIQMGYTGIYWDVMGSTGIFFRILVEQPMWSYNEDIMG